MSHRFCKAITISGGTCCLIADTTGCDNAGIPFFFASIRHDKIGKSSILCHNLFYIGIKMDVYSISLHFQLQCADNIRRMIRLRKYTVATLCLQTQSCIFKEIHHILVSKSVKTAVHKLLIGYHILEKFIHVTGIGDIASAFSRDEKLLSKFFIFLKYVDFIAIFRRKNRCEHTGSSAPYDQYFTHLILTSSSTGSSSSLE